MNIKESNTSAQGVKRLRDISKDLNLITKEMLDVNNAVKRLELSKESLRARFFELVDEHIKISGTTETEVLDIKCASRAEADQYVAENYPGWVVVQYKPEQTVIEEDPSQMKFVWVSDDGYQIGRTTALVGTKFDFESLRDANSKLFDEIVDTKTIYELNEKKAQKFIEEHPESLSVLQENTRLGKIQLRLSSPKKVVDE
jgi:hypothetical protein